MQEDLEYVQVLSQSLHMAKDLPHCEFTTAVAKRAAQSAVGSGEASEASLLQKHVFPK